MKTSKDKLRWQQNIWKKTFGCCFYCGFHESELKNKSAKFKKQNRLSVDHIVARIDGGKLNIENCVLACMKCNSHKGQKSFNEFRKERGPFWGEIMGFDIYAGPIRFDIPWDIIEHKRQTDTNPYVQFEKNVQTPTGLYCFFGR